jgi:hypothetical protein
MDNNAAPPEQIDRAVIVGMRTLVQNALTVGNHTVGEAGERAWGYCHARYPALPGSIIEQAVEYVLMELQLLPPVPISVEIDGAEFREIDDTKRASSAI